MVNRFYSWLSFRLPRKLVYFCAVRLFAEVTTGKYSSTVVPELTVIDALKRFGR